MAELCGRGHGSGHVITSELRLRWESELPHPSTYHWQLTPVERWAVELRQDTTTSS